MKRHLVLGVLTLMGFVAGLLVQLAVLPDFLNLGSDKHTLALMPLLSSLGGLVGFGVGELLLRQRPRLFAPNSRLLSVGTSAMQKFTQPRPRFSLRTMFIVLTLLCILIGINVDKLSQRRAALARFRGPDSNFVLLQAGAPIPWRGGMPLILRLLGAEPVTRISLHHGQFTEQDRDQLQSLFPEATVLIFKN